MTARPLLHLAATDFVHFITRISGNLKKKEGVATIERIDRDKSELLKKVFG